MTNKTPSQTKELTDALLAEDEEELEIPTQIPTQTQDSANAYPLAQTQMTVDQTQDTNASGGMPFLFRIPTSHPPLLSQLSHDSRWGAHTGFTQLEDMMRLQGQAQGQQSAYAQYPLPIRGIPFGANAPEQAQVQANLQTKAKGKKKAVPRKTGGKKTAAAADKEKKPSGRGPAFKETEAFALLDNVERRNTIAGRVNWELVCTAMENDGWPNRGVEATKRRYWEIINKAQKMPTGDPDVPKLLLRAREVHYSVRAANGVGDPSEESAAIEGEIQEITEGATAVRAEQISGEDELEDKKPQYKTPTNKSFVVRRASSATKHGGNVFDAIAQLQAAQMEESRRRAKEDKREKKQQNKLWLRIAAIGAAALMSSSADEETKKVLQKDILKQVINLESDDEDEKKPKAKKAKRVYDDSDDSSDDSMLHPLKISRV